MKQIILLNVGENTSKIEEEEQYRFLRSVLESSGIPLDFWQEDIPDQETIIKLRSVLESFNVIVLHDNESGMKVYVEKDLIAEWKKPYYILKKDLSAIDPKKVLYMEMHIETITIFDNEMEKE